LNRNREGNFLFLFLCVKYNINKAIEKLGQDYRYQDKQNPVKELQNRKKDNVTLGRSKK
jgi:hypothetical protein